MIKTGEVIQINDAANDGMQSLTVFGNTRQNLWVNPSDTRNGVTATANADGSVTISGSLETATSGSYNFTTQYILRPESTYTLSVDKAIGGVGTYLYISFHDVEGAIIPPEAQLGFSSAQSRVTFIVPTGAASVMMGIAVNPNTSPQTGTYRVMLNEGSEPEPWCPPGINGVDELSIVTAGKNLASTSESSAANFQLVDYFLPAGEYTLSIGDMPDGFAFNLRAPRGLGVGTSNDNVLANAQSSVTTFTLDYASPLYINGYSIPATPLQDIQLEAGSTATAYEPPAYTTTPVPLDGRSLNSLPDGTRDELTINEAGKLTLTQRVGVVNLTSDSTVSGTGPDGKFYDFTVPATSDGVAGNAITQMCDRLSIRNPDNNPYRSAWVYTLNHNGRARVGGMDGDEVAFPTANDLKTFLGADGITILYPLATPQEVELPGVSIPALRKRRPTVIFAAASVPAELELDYRKWRQGADGFRVGRRHSFWTEGQCIASSNSGAPEKKSSTKTVPYMSGFYDFSAVYGAVAFESRELQYRFEMVGEDMADLQEQKSALLNWVATIQDQDIYDDTVPGRHYRGSFDSADWEEGDEGESGALDVTFLCQPFLIDDDYTTAQCPVGTTTVTNGGEAVNPTAVPSDGTATVKINGAAQQISAETRLSIQLAPGDNEVEVSGSDVTLKWLRATL